MAVAWKDLSFWGMQRFDLLVSTVSHSCHRVHFPLEMTQPELEHTEVTQPELEHPEMTQPELEHPKRDDTARVGTFRGDIARVGTSKKR